MKKITPLLLSIVFFLVSGCAGDKKPAGSNSAADGENEAAFSADNNMKAFLAINKLLKGEPADQYPDYAGIIGDNTYEWYYNHSGQMGSASEFEKRRNIESLKPEVDSKIDAFDVSNPILFRMTTETEGKYNFERKGYKLATSLADYFNSDPRIRFESEPEYFIPMAEADAEEFEKTAEVLFFGFAFNIDLYLLVSATPDAAGRKVITAKLTRAVCKAKGSNKVLKDQTY